MIVEGFDPAINYGPNDAGISAITIILGIVGLIAFSWLFGKIYAQISKIFESNNKNNQQIISNSNIYIYKINTFKKEKLFNKLIRM